MDTTEILRLHKMWLESEEGGQRADLRGADLRGADLREAKLCGANLCGTNLREANLSGADLRGADLREANLCGANLCRAYLCEANLSGADLREAVLSGAYLCEAELSEAKIIYKITPEKGSFIAWKQAYSRTVEEVVLELEIPEDAKRISTYSSRKCRASKAIVLAVYKKNGKRSNIKYLHSQHDANFTYQKGQTIIPDKFDPDPRVECSYGIHFFMTQQEAVEW